MNNRYSMEIQWSDADEAFVVTLPEFENARTHGSTYDEAVANAQDVLDLLIETWKNDNRPLPTPQTLPVE
jgi:predicted RNase H-like HicB family nuclease